MAMLLLLGSVVATAELMLVDTEIRTFDFRTIASTTVNACADACHRDTACKAWTLRQSDGFCALKLTSSLMLSVSSFRNVGHVSGCSDVDGAVSCTPDAQNDIDFWGGDYKKRTDIGNVLACMQACHIEQRCKAWTFDDWSAHRGCYLKDKLVRSIRKNGNVSGCSGIRNGRHHRDCLPLAMKDTDIWGGDFKKITGLPNAEACMLACYDDGSCQNWTYDNWSVHHGCYLKRTQGTTVLRKVGNISGCRIGKAQMTSCFHLHNYHNVH